MSAEEKETEQKEEEMRGTVICLRRRNKSLKIDREDQYRIIHLKKKQSVAIKDNSGISVATPNSICETHKLSVVLHIFKKHMEEKACNFFRSVTSARALLSNT